MNKIKNKNKYPEGGEVGSKPKRSVTSTYNTLQIPLTDLNVIDKMIELGYHNDRNTLLKMTPEQRQTLIPQGSPLTWEKVNKGTANQGGYKYYEKNRVYTGTDITEDGKTVLKGVSPEYIKKNFPNHKYGIGGAIQMASPFLNMIPVVGGALAGAGQVAGRLIDQNEQKKQQEELLLQQKQGEAVELSRANQAGIVSRYGAVFATGGISPNGTEVEVETGEVLRNPNDGSLAKISEGAATHAQGGVDISAEPGTQIYGKLKVKSGRFKGMTYKDAADKIRKEIARLEKN